MIELGIAVPTVQGWIETDDSLPIKVWVVSDAAARELPRLLAEPVRRCYITDEGLLSRCEALLAEQGGNIEDWQAQLLDALLPPAGSTMAGDFGEILAFVVLASFLLDGRAIGAKKWRLKQDSAKPAPYTDMVQFLLPKWPEASEEDVILSAEVKAKATPSDAYRPVELALAGCHNDRISRLTRTLIWLRQRELSAPLGSITLAQLDRFLKPDMHPPALKHYRAVVVVCSSLWEGEKAVAKLEDEPPCELVVLIVPSLKGAYTDTFAEARKSRARITEDS